MADNTLFLYADEQSRQILEDSTEKIFLVGSDFGYGGNFGDILQLSNTIESVTAIGRFRTVTVMAASAIGAPDYPEFVRSTYRTDAVVFISHAPLNFYDTGLTLEPVTTVRSVSALYLYGGGFFNAMWGPFVLGVVEFLLDKLGCPTYLASGQQITPPFENEVARHLERYKPALVGVRDELSRSAMRAIGVEVGFSFDDATEALQKLAITLPVQPGSGLALHLNTSGYTNNAQDALKLRQDLQAIARHKSAFRGLTLFQAFGDRRKEVKDTSEAIKELERDFPFAEARLLQLPLIAYQQSHMSTPIRAEIGISCSYHTALWLQLAGIPCWLRTSNSYYDQKAQALQVSQDLHTFLANPKLADHSRNLERRSAWQEQVLGLLKDAPESREVRELPQPSAAESSPMWLRGYEPERDPTIEEKLRAQIEISHSQIEALRAHITELGNLSHSFKQRADAAEAEAEKVWRSYQSIIDSRGWQAVERFRSVANPIKRRLSQGLRFAKGPIRVRLGKAKRFVKNALGRQ